MYWKYYKIVFVSCTDKNRPKGFCGVYDHLLRSFYIYFTFLKWSIILILKKDLNN